MSIPSIGELWFRFDDKTQDDLYVVITNIRGDQVTAEYISMLPPNFFFVEFSRSYFEFVKIFRKKEREIWV